jgi:hypothetical protein
MFDVGFEKVAGLGQHALHAGIMGGAGAGIGALAGGERDHETGQKKNQSIGAKRGLGAAAGLAAGGVAAGRALNPGIHKALAAGNMKGAAGRILGAAALQGAAGYAGYKATKHFGKKYDYEEAQARTKANK